MIMQLSHHVVDCPICGRRVVVQSEHLSRELACSHCGGRFVMCDDDEGGLAAAGISRMNALERADELLQQSDRTTDQASQNRCRRLLELLSITTANDRQDEPEAAPADDAQELRKQPVALLVEYRDEVFARIATDMAKSGMRVIRAKSATESLKLCSAYAPVLVVANLDLPDQSGWLLAGKLRFIDQNIRVWLYQPQSSEYDEGLANFLEVDELLDYDGDLLGLSETILALIAERRDSNIASKDVRYLAAS